MNRIILMGRLTKDPAIRRSKENGLAIASYGLAVEQTYASAEKNRPDIFQVVAFGKRAEFAGKYLAKGIKIVVTGHVKTGSCIKKDGNEATSFEVVADEQEFAESKASNDMARGKSQSKEDFMEIFAGEDDAIPFD